MKMLTKTVAVLATAITVAVPASAETLRFANTFSSTHWWNTEGIIPFAEALAEATNGKFELEVYHGGQLGKETTAILSAGLADFGLLIPGYEPEKLPLASVVELPGFHRSSCEGTEYFWQMAYEGGALFEEEYSKLGVRPLFGIVLNPYEVQTSEKVIDSVDDMKGVKLRANGAMAKAVAALGGVPVQVTSAEFFDSVARGTVDGGMWLTNSTRLYGLEELLHNTVKGTAMGAGSAYAGVSEKTWQALDEETRQIIMEIAPKISQRMCEYLDRTQDEEEAAFAAEGKLNLNRLSPEQAALWNETISSVAEEWAAEMNKTGRPGTAMLEAYRAIATGN